MAVENLIIGGGAAGMMAAISAAQCGRSVRLLEGNRKLGSKILISGNGRCNLTNEEADSGWHYHGEWPAFCEAVLGRFPLRRTLDFFADLGIETHAEKRGRLFPLSNQAQSVVDLFEDRMRQLGVEVVLGAKVERLERSEGGFKAGTPDGRCWRGERVVMASGGLSVPKLGADRSGLELAKGLGHSCTRLYPGLVALISSDPYVHRMQGVKVWAEVKAQVDERRTASDTDDLLFTPYGVSGFTVLNLSASLVPRLVERECELEVNLFPGKNAEQVDRLLKERWIKNPHRSLEMSFAGLLNGKLVGPFLDRIGLPRERRVDALSGEQRKRLASELTGWRIGVSQPRSFAHAEVTIGGITTGEVDPETLESHLVPGLFFAGEMLDVHGDLGGFNFQWAWSSGYVAGQGGIGELER